ncbi:MAG: hypothetical protein LBU65_05465 [Planctomycetaceae bacterium]|nr:hypothetical protein [Planctomycetaceae bacterium]
MFKRKTTIFYQFSKFGQVIRGALNKTHLIELGNTNFEVATVYRTISTTMEKAMNQRVHDVQEKTEEILNDVITLTDKVYYLVVFLVE